MKNKDEIAGLAARSPRDEEAVELITECAFCGEVYGRHRSAFCGNGDNLHTWANTKAKPPHPVERGTK